MSDKKSEAVMVRLDGADQETLAVLARETGIKAATLARMALQAVLREYRINKRITLPLTIRLQVNYLQPEPAEQMLNEPAEDSPMGYNFGRSPGEPPPEDPPAPPAKKKSPPPPAGPSGAGAALPRSKPPAAGEASASA